MHYHVIASAVVWRGRTGAVRDRCSHRPANDIPSPPVPSAYVPSKGASASAPAGPLPTPAPPPLVVDSVIQFDRLLGCFTSWSRHAHGLCGRHAILFSYLSLPRWLGSSSWFPHKFQNLAWYRSITIEITMIHFHVLDPVPLSVPVYTHFLNSHYDFSLLCPVSFFGPVFLVFVG